MSICKYQEILTQSANNNEEEWQIKLTKYLGFSLPDILTLSDLISELNKVFSSNDVNIEFVRYLMTAYKSNPIEWKTYAKFNRYKYTRNLVDDGNGKYNLLTLCWGEGQGAGIHDHSNSHCFMKILQGSLEEVRYEWPKNDNEELKEIGRNRLNLNDVCYINDSMGLHKVENVSSYDTAISLHLYCPPYTKCSIFNKNTGKKTTAQVTFYSMFGSRNKEFVDTRVPENN